MNQILTASSFLLSSYMMTEGEEDDCGGDGGDADVLEGVPAVGVLLQDHYIDQRRLYEAYKQTCLVGNDVL